MNELRNLIQLWIAGISATENLPESVQAIYIGLIESDPNYVIYFIGSNTIDADDDDWACDQDFEPMQKYLDSQISTEKDWEEFQDLVIAIIKEIVDEDSSSILNKVEHVSVGFDEGDLTHIK